MNQTFIVTPNIKKFGEICDELGDTSSLIGPSLAMVTGPTGRGKTEAAKHYATQTEAVYISPFNIRTPAWVLREIAFELGGVRPGRAEACLTVISEETSKRRRLILLDEADLLEIKVLEMLRNLNERCACPIVLIGENALMSRVASRKRIESRVRRKMEFAPCNQHDIAFFLRQTFTMSSSPTPEIVSLIHKHCNGDWRPVVTVTIGIDRAMKASGTSEITAGMVKDVIKNA